MKTTNNLKSNYIMYCLCFDAARLLCQHDFTSGATSNITYGTEFFSICFWLVNMTSIQILLWLILVLSNSQISADSNAKII